ncbi:TPA: hypothetical protein N0F65_011922 [Lagenidium giganteum]|uniref:Charged multivesicular body protein 2a n=1 Tax=Lagenidium giganteum TaxID=4803 RepID=A0AAV2YQR3_9STRA|nr:TPA: hypothetical protein N0F65_011922 [Lagenidium giganteum]
MDCTNPKIKDVDAMATQLKDISWSSALVIAFRNCKALRVPVAIQQLQSLVGIHVTNSSIAQWDAAAALTAERHPSLRFVYVVDTNIGSIPLGMLAPNAPPTLTHVLFRRCRLSTLPLTAADVWPPGMALGLEDVGLSSTLPPVLERMRLSQLSLANNNIARVPASVFNRSELVVLVLDGNPLTELPSDAVVSTSLRSVSIRNTSISTFPVQMQAPIHIWASSTPLCSASGANATASTSIDCAPWPLYHPTSHNRPPRRHQQLRERGHATTMGNALGKKKTLKEQLRENKREINRAIRELDRERLNMQNQEKKLIIEIKKMAKEGQISSVKIMAKDLVRTRQHVNKFYTMRSQLQAVALRLETAKSAEAMTSALAGTTKAMQAMAKSMNLPRLNQIMMEYTKESERMEMQQEMIGDTIDDVMDADQDEEETDKIVGQVLDEIGIDLTGNVPEAPVAQAAATQPAQPAMIVPPAAPVAAGAAPAGGSDAAMSELEARLNNLRRS